MLTIHRLLVCVGVPLAVLFLGTIGKKLARGPGGFIPKDWDLGGDLMLAGLTSYLVYMVEAVHTIWTAFFDDLGHPQPTVDPNAGGALWTLICAAILAVVVFYVYLCYVSDAQELSDENKLFLPFQHNIFGLASMVVSIALMKG